MDESRLGYLAERALSNRLTRREKRELDLWLSQSTEHQKFYDALTSESSIQQGIRDSYTMDEARISGLLEAKVGFPLSAKVHTFPTVKLMVAAAAIGIIALSFWFFYPSHRNPVTDRELAQANTIKPGRNTATLRLANDSIVDLTGVHNGTVVMQGGVQVVSQGNGIISYMVHASNMQPAPLNTVTTPLSGQYQLVLSDGTHVWLNNSSQITFPTNFQGKERLVELSGEGYFEIAKDPAKPFKVKVRGGDLIEVLGTKFNVSAYPDDRRVTTLVEGSIRMRRKSQSVILQPGQEVSATDSLGSLVLSPGDTRSATAWTRGFFSFTNATVKTILVQLSRWYGVSVQYVGNGSTQRFDCTIPRDANFDDVLRILKSQGISCSINGNVVTVNNQ